MKKEYHKSKGRWHALCIVDGEPFYPHPQSSFMAMRNVAGINGGGYVWHGNFPRLVIRTFKKI